MNPIDLNVDLDSREAFSQLDGFQRVGEAFDVLLC